MTYFKKNFNLSNSFLTRTGLSYFTCAFLVARPSMLYHNFWHSDLDLDVWPILKNFNLDHSFLYYTCTFLVTRPFRRYKNFRPCDLDLDVWPIFKKNFNLGHSFLIRRVRTFILHMYIPCDKTFPSVLQFLN